MGTRAKNSFPYLQVAKDIVSELASVNPNYFEREAPDYVRIGAQYARVVLATRGASIEDLRGHPPLTPLFHWKDLACNSGTKLSRLTSKFLLYLYLEPLGIPARRRWTMQHVNWDGIEECRQKTVEPGVQRAELIQRYLHEYFDSRNVFRNLKRTRCAAGRSPTPPPRRPVPPTSALPTRIPQPALPLSALALGGAGVAPTLPLHSPVVVVPSAPPLAAGAGCFSLCSSAFDTTTCPPAHTTIPDFTTPAPASPFLVPLPTLPDLPPIPPQPMEVALAAAPVLSPFDSSPFSLSPCPSPPHTAVALLPTMTTTTAPLTTTNRSLLPVPAAAAVPFFCPVPPTCSPLVQRIPSFPCASAGLRSPGLQAAASEPAGLKGEVDFIAEAVVTDFSSDHLSFLDIPDN